MSLSNIRKHLYIIIVLCKEKLNPLLHILFHSSEPTDFPRSCHSQEALYFLQTHHKTNIIIQPNAYAYYCSLPQCAVILILVHPSRYSPTMTSPCLALVIATQIWWRSVMNPKCSLIHALSAWTAALLLMIWCGIDRTVEKITKSNSLPRVECYYQQ